MELLLMGTIKGKKATIIRKTLYKGRRVRKVFDKKDTLNCKA